MKFTRILGNTSTMLGGFLLCAALTADGVMPVGDVEDHLVYIVVFAMIGMGYAVSILKDEEL